MTDILGTRTCSSDGAVDTEHLLVDHLNHSRRRSTLLDPSSSVPTYIGIATVVAGFVLIIIGWAKVASLTNVALQLPYVVSAGIAGLGLIMVGLLVINITAKRQDAAERCRQLQQLAAVLSNHRRNDPPERHSSVS